MTSFADPGSYQPSPDVQTRSVRVNLDADVSAYTQAINLAQQQTEVLTGAVGQLTNQMTTLSGYAAKKLTFIDRANTLAFAAAAADAAHLEHQLSTLRATSKVTGSSMTEMKKQLDATFDKFPVSRAQVVQLAETITNLGVTSPKAVGSLTKTFIKLGGATGEDANQLAGGTMQLSRMMGNTDPEQLEKYANSLVTLKAKQGVATSGVLEFGQAIAPVARMAGMGQAAVQGIAAAFTKAGSDGFVAANAFNQIVTEITRLNETGSPELAKYANIVGKSAEQFRGQTATQQSVDLFTAISRGGVETNSAIANLGLPARAARAIQAVGQAGGLAGPIAESEQAATNTENLEAASKEAFTGLTDSALELGNKFVKLGEILGGPTLFTLTKLTDFFGVLMDGVNKLVAALDPLPGILSDFVTILSGPAIFALKHFSTIMMLAAARTLLGPNSMPRVAYKAGREAGQAIAGGMTRDEALALTPIGRRVAGGEANLRTQMGFEAGVRAGEKPGWAERNYGVGPAGLAGQGLIGARNVVVGGATWVLDENIRAGRDARIFGPLRSGNVERDPNATLKAHIQDASLKKLKDAGIGAVVEAATTGGSMIAATAGGGWRSIGRAREAAEARKLRLETKKAADEAAAAVDITGMTAAQARVAKETARTTVMAAAAPKPTPPVPALTGAAASLAAAGIRNYTGTPLTGAPAVDLAGQAGGAVAKTGGKIYQGVAATAGAIFSGPGMLATMIGIPLIGSIVSAIKEGNAARLDVSGSLAGSERYDQVLNRTSTNLARFGDAVTGATNRLAGLATTPVEQTTTVTGTDRAAVESKDYKISDPNLQGIVQAAAESANKPGGDPDAVKKAMVSYLSGRAIESGEMTGDRSTVLKQDILAAMRTTSGGADQSKAVTEIMNAWVSQPGGMTATPNFASIGALAGKQTDIGLFQNVFGGGMRSLKGGVQLSGDEGRKALAKNMLAMAAEATAGGTIESQEARIEQIGQYLQSTYQIDPTEFRKQLFQAGREAGTAVSAVIPGSEIVSAAPYRTVEEAIPVLATAVSRTPQGGGLLSSTGMSLEDLIAGMRAPSALPPPSVGDLAVSLGKKGPLGQYAATEESGVIAASVGKSAGQPGAGLAAAQNLIVKAVEQADGDLAKAGEALTQLADAMGGVADPTGRLINSAVELSQQMRGFRAPELSREAQFTQTAQVSHTWAQLALPENKPTQETVDTAKRYNEEYQTAKENYRQYMISRIQQTEQFNTQQARAVADHSTSVSRSNRDFNESQRRSDHDYNLSRLRSQEDFQLQARRSLEDYQLSVRRQNEDHARELSRQAQSASQEIYDPYIRIQRKATTDAGTLVQNLGEQNRDIERQLAQVQELRARGLSQQAVDTLKLTDVGNAQQTDTLLRSLQQAPDKTQEINDLITKRLGSTTALTQSPFSMAFRQQEEDFARSMERGSDDFSKAQDRSADDQAKALNRMATDFGETRQRAVSDHRKALADMAADFAKAQKQAADDLATSFKQYTGDFASIFESLSTNSLGALAKYAPEASAIITKELAKVKAENPWLTPTKTQGDMFGIRSLFAAFMGKGKDTSTGFIGGMSQEMGRALGMPGYATGGISLTEQVARVSEHGPELHLPLNSRGENFMAGLIARSLAQGITAAVPANASSGANMVSNDSSISFAGADIRVVAQDPNEMAKALAARAKLARLASPLRH